MTIVCKPRIGSRIFGVAGLTIDGGRSMSRAELDRLLYNHRDAFLLGINNA